jgi:NADPH-dependent glutamate synthase beta subunit-like oxidoreductase
MARSIAIIGSGPAGYYAAEALAKLDASLRIDIIDRLPTPYGLIRAGVAPDHQSIKAVAKRYEATSLLPNVRFVGNLRVGDAVSLDELRGLYDAVILATGAPGDRELGIDGSALPGVIGSAAFVGWYNSHPDFADLNPPLETDTVAVIGNGNVAIDVARVLVKQPDEMAESDLARHAAELIHAAPIRKVVVLGRRGPLDASFTPKELGEMGELTDATAFMDPAQLPPESVDAGLEPALRKVMTALRGFGAATPGAKRLSVEFRFFRRPVRVLGESHVTGLELERTAVVDGKATGTGEIETLSCGLIVPCIGYRTQPIAGAPFDNAAGRFVNEAGKIADGLYCVGWAKRGPSGTIGTNRPDSIAVAERIAQDIADGNKAGGQGLDQLIQSRDLWTTIGRRLKLRKLPQPLAAAPVRSSPAWKICWSPPKGVEIAPRSTFPKPIVTLG